MGELPRRAAIGEAHGDGRSPRALRLAQLAAASLAEPIQDRSWKVQRPFPPEKSLETGYAVDRLSEHGQVSTGLRSYLRLRIGSEVRRQNTGALSSRVV
eukprot:5642719-Prymnesium_polylepis.3